MDAIYAWDQPDIHLHVPRGDHHSAVKAIRFQTSLREAGAFAGSFQWTAGVAGREVFINRRMLAAAFAEALPPWLRRSWRAW